MVYPKRVFRQQSAVFRGFPPLFQSSAAPNLPAKGLGRNMGTDLTPGNLRAHRYSSGIFSVCSRFQRFQRELPHAWKALTWVSRNRGGPLCSLLMPTGEDGNTSRRPAVYVRGPSGRKIEANRALTWRALDVHGKWVRVVDDMGFPPAGGPRTMTS